MFDDMKLKAHGKIVMDALGAAVECLDDSSQMTNLLVGIGERHALYGVQPNMIPVCNICHEMFTWDIAKAKLTLKVPSKICRRRHSIFSLLLFFRDNKSWQFI